MTEVAPDQGEEAKSPAPPIAESAPEEKLASVSKMFSLATPTELCIFLVGFLGTIGHGLAQPIACTLFGDLIDGLGSANLLAVGPNMWDIFSENMAKLCLKMCYFAILSFGSAWTHNTCFNIFSDRQVQKMRVLYFDAVLHQDISWFDSQQVAQLPIQIGDDIEQVGEALGSKLGSGFQAVFGLISGYVAAFVLGYQVALVMCATIPLLMLAGLARGRAVKSKLNETQSWYAKAGAVVEECLYAIRTVVSFGGEHREIEKYSKAVVQARKGGVWYGFTIGVSLGYTGCVIFLGYAVAFYYGMTLRYDGVINPSTGEIWNPGRILSIFFCVFVGSNAISQLDPAIKCFHSGRVGAAHFFSVLEQKTTIQYRGQDARKSLQNIESMKLQDVHFSYPTRPDLKVLNGLNIIIKRGQKVAVVGESGSGKSTVMSLLERFYDPTSGLVLVNGQDVRDYSISSLRRNIGYVGQEPVLFATTIRENILQGCHTASHETLMQACADAQLTFVDHLPEKLDTYVGSGGSQFSGGQKQRIAIARALIKQAGVLFLDEATSALDNKSEKMIQRTIDDLARSKGGDLAIVSIAHRLSTIRGADLIYVLSHGKVAEQGNHASLMQLGGLYYALAASQESAAKQDYENQGDVQANTANEVEEQGKENEKDGAVMPVAEKSAVVATVALTHKEREEAEKKRMKEIANTYKVPWSRLLSYNKQEWIYFIPAILGAIGDGGAMPVAAVLLVQSMNAYFKPKDQMRHDLEQVCLMFVYFGFGQFFCTVCEWVSFSILGEALTQRLRVALLKTMFRQEIGFHDDPDNTPGMLNKALELYTFRVSTFIKAIGSEAAAISSIGVGIGLAFGFCWEMSLVMLVSIPITIATNALTMMVLLGSAKREDDAIRRAQQVVSDSVQNARTVQALGNERELVSLYSRFVDDSSKGFVKRHILGGVGFGFSNGVLFLILAGGFYFAAWLVKTSRADFQGVMTAFMGIFYAGMGAGRAAAMMGDFTKAKVACSEMFKLLDRASKIEGLEPKGTVPSEINAGRIEFFDVKFFYPFRAQVQVLKGMSFTILPGQSVGLVGPSGGGKSTVMALLQRFYDPVEGMVLVGEQRANLADLNIRWWRRQVGFVGQEPVLFNTTVRNNVLYGLEDGETISPEMLEECKRRAHLDFLDTNGKNGLDTEVGPRGSQLSGGQKQRVAICRALIRNPALLLLDEATSALDTQSEKIVQTALEEARQGRTSFAIAHRLSSIQGCDVILVVAEGIIIEKGTHDELMQLKGTYYGLQMQSAH